MKKIILLIIQITIVLNLSSQIDIVNNELSVSDRLFISNKSKKNNNLLSPRGSTVKIQLDYPKADSLLQNKVLGGTIIEKTFFWEMRNSKIDTNNLPSNPTNGFNTKGLVQGYSDLAYFDNQNNLLFINSTKATITIDSINPFFTQFTKGGTGNDTIIFDVFEDSVRFGKAQSCGFDLNISGGKLVASDTLVVVSAGDLDTYMFRKKVTLDKGAGFMFRVRLFGHLDSKFRCYASYSENCSDSAFARVSQVGYNFYSSVYKPTSNPPYRLALWSTSDLNTTLACKKMYTQNWLIFPFLSVTVDSPSVIVSNSQTNTLRCQGNQAQLFASAQGYSSTSLTYSWSPATGLSASNIANPIATVGTANVTYTVTVTDGTTPITSTTVIVSSQPTVNITANKTVLSSCIDSVRLTSTGSTGVSYSWSNGTSSALNIVRTVGTYMVTVSNVFGCTATASSPVITSTFSAPTLDFAFTPSANICPNKDVEFKVASSSVRAGWTYKWTESSTSLASNGETITHKFTSSGSKSVKLNADSSVCKATEVSKNVTILPATDTKCKVSISIADNDNLKIFPNPVRDGKVYIQNDMNQSLSYRVTDMLGKVVSADKLVSNKESQVDLSSAPNGIYFIEVESKGEKVIKKIIVDKQ